MILVGLTGGVATGKTTIARMFRRCGAIVIDADELARAAVAPGRPAWRDIVRNFGPAILNPDRTLNRQALGSLVFAHPTKRRLLERIIHPRVAREQIRLTRAAARAQRDAVVIYDVPLLFEAGIDARVDAAIVVTADRGTQIARLRTRNHLNRAEALRRIISQWPLRDKIRRADYVLDGTRPRRALAGEVRRLYRTLQAQAVCRTAAARKRQRSYVRVSICKTS